MVFFTEEDLNELFFSINAICKNNGEPLSDIQRTIISENLGISLSDKLSLYGPFDFSELESTLGSDFLKISKQTSSKLINSVRKYAGVVEPYTVLVKHAFILYSDAKKAFLLNESSYGPLDSFPLNNFGSVQYSVLEKYFDKKKID